MNISGAEKHIEKILDFMGSVHESEHALYDSSKQRLKHISEVCNELNCLVSEILQSAKPRGFDPDAHISQSSEIQELKERVDRIEDKVDGIHNFTSETDITTQTNENNHDLSSSEASDSAKNFEAPNTKQSELAIQNDPDVSVSSDNLNQKTDENKLSPNQARLVTHLYAKTLQKAANSDCDSPAAKECFDLIWKWYNKRVIYKSKKFKRVRFDCRNLRHYIYAIVICFGYHMENDTLDSFIERFEAWINEIGVSQEITEKFMVPYEINQIYNKEYQKNNVQYSNLTAAILWDIMWDNGYSELSSIKSIYGVSLRNDDVYDKIDKFGLDTLDGYVQYKENPGILHQLHLS